MASGKAITLKFNHNYIEDSVLVFSCGECSVFLIHEFSSNQPTFVELRFQSVMCVRSARTDCTPAMGIYPEQSGVSFIVELTDSPWAVEAHKAYVYPRSSLTPSGRHFVVSNHDIFHEVLAESFTESLVRPGDSNYEFAKSLFAL